MKVIINEQLVYYMSKEYAKSPASLTPAEKIQLLEEMGIDAKNVVMWVLGDYAINLRQYIEEMK